MLKPKNITLERVKQSNYWKLISIMVWNHYIEEKYQDENMIDIKEQWYGKAEGGSSHNKDWDNPNYAEKGYVRTLGDIIITFTRTDYITYIFIRVETGNIEIFGSYQDKEVKKSPCYHYGTTDVTNWMLENDLLEYLGEFLD